MMRPSLARLLSLPRRSKQLLAVLTDIALCMITVWLAICLRFEDWIFLHDWQWLAVIASPCLAIPIFVRLGLYRAIFRYAGRQTVTAIVRALGIYALLFATLFTVISFPLVPRTIVIIQPLLLLVCISATRLAAQRFFGPDFLPDPNDPAREAVLIYGAGPIGQQLAQSLRDQTHLEVLGFVDDDVQLIGGQIQGLTVHSAAQIESICRQWSIRHILLAQPGMRRESRHRLLQSLRPLNVSVRILPSLGQIVDRAHSADARQLRALKIEDLLGRDPVAPITQLLQRNIQGQCVLITGGGGSIGAELARQALLLEAAQLVIFESSEYALYAILEELEQSRSSLHLKTTLHGVLGNVTHESDLRRVFEKHRPATVFHAAAFKHVPIVESNIHAAVHNNIVGTHLAARVARECGVRSFTLISSDKAVRPTNIMGATKRAAELCIHLAQTDAQATTQAGIAYSIVRFGNVLGSSGSVVPKFRAQIAAGGPLTLTHPDITRYFMTIGEAAQLVIQASALSIDTPSPHPSTCLLDMGDAVRIQDLAYSMIQLSGNRVKHHTDQGPGIEMVYTGLRPGEKLYEELLISGQSASTSHPKIFIDPVLPTPQQISDMRSSLAQFKAADPGISAEHARAMLQNLVPDFKSPDTD